MYCGKCGSIINSGDLFCTKCGTKIDQDKVTNTSKFDDTDYEKISLNDLELSVRDYNYLKRAGINNLKQILEIYNVGLSKAEIAEEHTFDEVINIVKKHIKDSYTKDELTDNIAFDKLCSFLLSDLSRTNDKNLTINYYKGNSVCNEYYYAIKYVLLIYYNRTDIEMSEEWMIDLVKLYKFIEKNTDVKEEVNKALLFYQGHCNELKNLTCKMIKREFNEYLCTRYYGCDYVNNKYFSNFQFLQKILNLDAFKKLYEFLESRESRTDNTNMTAKYFKGDDVCMYYYLSIKYVLLKYFNKTKLTAYKCNNDSRLNKAYDALESEVNILELYDFVETNYDVKDIVLKGVEYYKKNIFDIIFIKNLNNRLLKKDFDDFLISVYKE